MVDFVLSVLRVVSYGLFIWYVYEVFIKRL